MVSGNLQESFIIRLIESLFNFFARSGKSCFQAQRIAKAACGVILPDIYEEPRLWLPNLRSHLLEKKLLESRVSRAGIKKAVSKHKE